MTHLEPFERVIAILLLAQSHFALFTILLDLATQKPLELPAIAEIKILAHSCNEFLVHGFVAKRRQSIIHIFTQENLG